MRAARQQPNLLSPWAARLTPRPFCASSSEVPDDISTPGFRRLALSQRNKPFRFFIPDLAHCLQWQTCMVNSVTGSLEKYMDVLAARQKLVAANIANADTPGYRTQDIDFQTEFKNRLDGTPNIGGQEVSGLRVKNDGNNVSLDREARLLSENSIRFNAASNLMKGQLRMMKSAIHDGQS
jgi:flagellar basal-body rod protein FlgB